MKIFSYLLNRKTLHRSSVSEFRFEDIEKVALGEISHNLKSIIVRKFKIL